MYSGMEGMEHLPLGPPITIKPIVLRSIAVFLASLILIPTLLLILRPGTADAWFDDSYAYRQKITFTHNANLTNASMRLTVSNTNILIIYFRKYLFKLLQRLVGKT